MTASACPDNLRASVEQCNLCGAPGVPAPYPQRDLLRCTTCGLTWSRCIPDGDELHRLYDQEYSNGHSFNRFYAGLALARQTEARLRARELRRRVAGRDLLDIGSGMGYFVQAALAEGWRALGLEISATAIERTAPGLPVLNTSFEEYKTCDRFDTITLWAMLEYVRDPHAVLRKCYDLLRPGGTIVIETGDLGSRNARHDGQAWRMFDIPGHLYFLSGDCIDQALQRLGFDILYTRLDKWVEHTLMKHSVQDSLITANRHMSPRMVRAATWVTHAVNRLMSIAGYGDVMIKIPRKSAGNRADASHPYDTPSSD